MRLSKELKEAIMDSILPYLDRMDKSTMEEEMERLENNLDELIAQVEMETRIEKNHEQEGHGTKK